MTILTGLRGALCCYALMINMNELNKRKKVFNKNNVLKRSHAASFLSCVRHDDIQGRSAERLPVPFKIRIYMKPCSSWGVKHTKEFIVGSVQL